MIVGRRLTWWLSIAAASTLLLLLTESYRRDFHRPALTWITNKYSPSTFPSPSKPSGGEQGLELADIDYDNAHHLPTADAFWESHFGKVLALRGLTLNETRAGCKWKETVSPNFQFGADTEWNVKDRPESELESRRKEWQDFVRHDMIPWSQVDGRYSGRGIVIISGNGDTKPRTKVLLRALNKLGTTLPVEIHYYGEREMNTTDMAEVLEVYPNAYFNDLSGPHNVLNVSFYPNWLNYQLKTAALVESRFAEILMLDNDNIPTVDPTELFDAPTYKEFGTVFWPDIARTRPSNPAWPVTNTLCRMDEYEQESGQLLVNKLKFWYHLQLALRINDDDAYWDGFLLGDKDTFRFAWHALKTRYGTPKRWVTSVGMVNPDGRSEHFRERKYCGHTFAQHHPDDGRVAFMHGGLLKQIPNEVVRWNRDHAGGIYRQFKRSQGDTDLMTVQDVGIDWVGDEYMPHPPVQNHPCTDFYGVKARELEEIAPGFEELFRDIGGYWFLEQEKVWPNFTEPARVTGPP